MRKSITFFLLAFFLSVPTVLAQSDLKLQENAPDRYTVEKGDTLWGIASKFLKDPWRWQEIWRLNQDQIKDPHRIYPGNVIVLDRNARPPQLSVGIQTLKLSPQVRSESGRIDAIPSIPPNVIEPFLSRPLVIEEGGLDKAARIVGTEESRVHLGPGGFAYVSGTGKSSAVNWQIFRPGRPLIDPDTNKTLGFEAVYLGSGRITRAGEPSTLQVVTAVQEISQGDRLIPTASAQINQYAPHAPRAQIKGRVIALYGGLSTSEGGKDSIVSLNRGRRDGLEIGHVLAILRTGAVVPDSQSYVSRDSAPTVTLPDERYGIVFVFRVFDSVSYALVMESSRPVVPGDTIQTP